MRISLFPNMGDSPMVGNLTSKKREFKAIIINHKHNEGNILTWGKKLMFNIYIVIYIYIYIPDLST